MIRILRPFVFLLCIIGLIFNLQILSIFSFVLYIIFLFSNNKKFFLIYLYIIFQVATNIIGVFTIEYSEIYLYEIEQWSMQANSLPSIILVHMIFLETLNLCDKFWIQNKEEKIRFSKGVINLITFVTILILLFLFIKVINKPYFILGYDRFAYQKYILTSIDEKLGNLTLYFVPLFYMSYKFNKKLGITAIFIFYLYFFWIGHKFSIFFMAFQLGMLVIYQYLDAKRINKYLLMIVLTLTLFVITVMIQNVLVYDISWKQNFDYLKSRLAQQGQLWWGVYKEKECHRLHLEEARKEVDLFFKLGADNNPQKYNLGMYKVMRLVAPDYRVDFKISQGSRYAYSTQANLLYYFNYPILIVLTIIMGVFFYFITRLLIKSVMANNFISVILLSKFYINYVRFLTNSDFYTIFSLETLLILSVVLIVNLVLNLREKNPRYLSGKIKIQTSEV